MTGTIPYRCLDCGHEFKAGSGPVRGGALHDLPGAGHPAAVAGACPACGSLYVGRLTWHVLATNSGAEPAVAARLRTEGYSVLWLHYWVTIRPRNRKRTVRRPMMPGYVFLGVVPEPDYYAIATLPGVAAMLTTEAGHPYRLDQSEIDRLRVGADNDGCVVLEEPETTRRRALEVGSVVRILSGPFQGFEGPVMRDNGKQLLTVKATMFGRETDVELPFQAVEAA